MNRIAQILQDSADFYQRPFNKLPESEKMYLAEYYVRYLELEAEMWLDEAGLTAFKDISLLLRGRDYEAAGKALRLFWISASGVEQAYAAALERALCESSP